MIKIDEVQPAQDMSFNQNRYKVDCFKTTNAKRVPYKELDYTIYKPNANMVTFSTSEKRLPLWIKTMRQRYQHGFNDDTTSKITSHWQEQDSPKEPSKCEKVVITLSSKEKSENIICITIMVNTGRIQIQGHSMKTWGSEEFPTLVNLVNSPNNSECKAMEKLENFVDKVSSSQKCLNQVNHQVPNASPGKQHVPEDTSEQSLNDKPFSVMKTTLASLEADFVEFKQNTNKSVLELNALLTTKDEKILKLGKEIDNLKSEKSQINRHLVTLL
jgi:hypothetical protein